jgi:hypothetical protein
MVKPLKDILAEIEERQPVRRFQAGGSEVDSFEEFGLSDAEQGQVQGFDASAGDNTEAMQELHALADSAIAEVGKQNLGESELSDIYSKYVASDTSLSKPDIISGGASDDTIIGSSGGKEGDDLTKQPGEEKGFWDYVIDVLGFIGPMLIGGPVGGLAGLATSMMGTKGVGTGKPGAEVHFGPPGHKAIEFAGNLLDPIQKEIAGAIPSGIKNLGDEVGKTIEKVTDPITGGIKEIAEMITPNPITIGGGTSQPPPHQVAEARDKPVSPPQPKKNGYTPPPSYEDLDTTPVVTPTQKIAREIAEVVVEPETKKGWSFDQNVWYPSAQGGPIESYQMGGLAGMMNKQMGLQQQYQDEMWQTMTPEQRNQYRGGNRPARPPQHGGFGLGLPRPPGFFDPRGPRPPRPPQQPRLEPETYFHEHEGGKVTYPNFPKPFVNPPDRPNILKGGGKQIAAEPDPYQTHVQALFDKVKTDRRDIEEPAYSPLEPVPPISISETTATAMEPEAVEEATQQTTIEEARPVPREIDIQMPENITATLDFPEEVTGTANYRRGGIASLLRGLAPLAAGWALGPMGHVPAMLAGAGTQYALAGKKRSFLDAIKGGLAGYSGSAVGRLGTAAAGQTPGQLAGKTTLGDRVSGIVRDPTTVGTKAVEELGVMDLAKRGWQGGTSAIGQTALGTGTPVGGYLDQLGKQATGLWDMAGAGSLDAYGRIASELAGPAAAMIGQTAITTPAERPEVAEIEVAQYQAMTPEQRRAYIESKRAKYGSSPMMQPTVFAPPNVDIGWQPNYAAEGGVMEIDEEMESGSFVLPADVVSNVGDGSSDAGHRRLTQLFGGGDEYALGGGTGILKGPVKGVGSGLDDLIQTGIDGVKVARLSSDEFVVPKDVVRRLGNGSQKAGSEKLYDFMKDVRLKKHGTAEQPKEIHMSGLRKMV